MQFDLEQDANAIIDNMKEQSREIKDVADRLRRTIPPPVFRPTTMQRKLIEQGPKGGLYYRDVQGKKVYLTPGQCQKCEHGLYGDGGCPPNPPRLGVCQPSRVSLKRKIRKLKKSRKSLKRRLSKKKDC
jgi:hypothetical protein